MSVLPLPASVAVVGGGWAGCAAAVKLSQAGFKVALFEQARTLGGRARRIGFDGLTLDNGQHLLIGAYRQTLAMIGTVHGAGRRDTLLRRIPLTLAPFGRRTGAVAFTAWRAPVPMNVAAGILTARGLTLRERFALIGGFRRIERAGFACPPAQTVAECFAASPRRAMEGAWSPLCVAALNTPPARASAHVFANVLRGTFTGRAGNSDFLVPATDLSALFPDAAAQFIETRGGTAHIGACVRGVIAEADGVTIATNAGSERFAAAIIAVGPHQLAATLGGDGGQHASWRASLALIAAFRYESITTVYLAYPSAVPLPAVIARLDDAPGQWVFDRSTALPSPRPGIAQGLLAVVISASGPHDALDQTTLAAAVDAQLRRLQPGLPKAMWSRVIAERRATYSCVPALVRPAAGRVAPRLYLAGDYTDAEFPATLEAATRSGTAAAGALIGDLRAAAG